MPRHSFKAGPGLNIDITDFQSVYLPGDTLLGHVSCSQVFPPPKKKKKKATDNASRAEVRIRLFGRAKTKVVRTGHDNTTET